MAYQHTASGRKRAKDWLARTGTRLGNLSEHLKSGGYPQLDDAAADKKMIKRAIGEHDAQLHPGERTRLKLAEGGIADDCEAPMRGDRAQRGSKGAKNHIAIIVAPQGEKPPPMPPIPPPRPMPPPSAVPPPPQARPPGPPVGPPPPMGMVPPGAIPPGLPPGPPMMRKAGGRAHRAVSTAALMDEDVPRPKQFPEMDGPERDPRRIETASAQGDDFMPGEKQGGRARRRDGGSAGRAHMTAGADSGAGRLEKSRQLDDYCGGGRARK